MKPFLTIIFAFIIQIGLACNCLDFKDAKKQSINVNKFILAHFSDDFISDKQHNGYLKIDGISTEEEKVFNQKFIYVCIATRNDIYNLRKKYAILEPTELLILDGLGQEIFRFNSKYNSAQVLEALTIFSVPIPELSIELQEFNTTKSYNSSRKVCEKYLDYAIGKNIDVKNKLQLLAAKYLNEGKSKIKKIDISRNIKLQNFELLSLNHWALVNRFDVINENLEKFAETTIYPENKSLYYFLKILVAKKLNNPKLEDIQSKFIASTDYNYYSKRLNLFHN